MLGGQRPASLPAQKQENVCVGGVRVVSVHCVSGLFLYCASVECFIFKYSMEIGCVTNPSFSLL